jgi:hypothetical protein
MQEIIITFLLCITGLGIAFLIFLDGNMFEIMEKYGMKKELKELTKRVEDLEKILN